MLFSTPKKLQCQSVSCNYSTLCILPAEHTTKKAQTIEYTGLPAGERKTKQVVQTKCPVRCRSQVTGSSCGGLVSELGPVHLRNPLCSR